MMLLFLMCYFVICVTGSKRRNILKCTAKPSQDLPDLKRTASAAAEEVVFPLHPSTPESSGIKMCSVHSMVWLSLIHYEALREYSDMVVWTFGSSKRCFETFHNIENDQILVSFILGSAGYMNVTLQDQGRRDRDNSVLNMLQHDWQFRALLGVSEKILMYLTHMLSNESDSLQGSQLPILDRIALTLCKLRHNLSFEYLGFLFGVKSTVCEFCFHVTVGSLAVITKHAVCRPSKEEVVVCMPESFKDFEDARVVLDFIEVSVARPDCLECITNLGTSFDVERSLQVMVGFGLSGFITFISSIYSSRLTESQIFENSFLNKDLLDPFVDAIVVKDSIHLNHICSLMNIKVHQIRDCVHMIQTSSAGFTGRSLKEIKKTLQSFKILHETLSWSLIPLVNKIVTVVAGVTNLMLSQCK